MLQCWDLVPPVDNCLFQIWQCGALQPCSTLAGAEYPRGVQVHVPGLLPGLLLPGDLPRGEEWRGPVQVPGGLRAPPDRHLVVTAHSGRWGVFRGPGWKASSCEKMSFELFQTCTNINIHCTNVQNHYQLINEIHQIVNLLELLLVTNNSPSLFPFPEIMREGTSEAKHFYLTS